MQFLKTDIRIKIKTHIELAQKYTREMSSKKINTEKKT